MLLNSTTSSSSPLSGRARDALVVQEKEFQKESCKKRKQTIGETVLNSTIRIQKQQEANCVRNFYMHCTAQPKLLTATVLRFNLHQASIQEG